MRTRRKKKGEKRKSDCKDAKDRCMHTCGEKFSEDFPRAPKLQKTHRSIITTKTQGFTWKSERETPRERKILL